MKVLAAVDPNQHAYERRTITTTTKRDAPPRRCCQKKPTRTFRRMATVREETDRDVEREGYDDDGGGIPHGSPRANAAASHLAMSIIHDDTRRTPIDVSRVGHVVALLRHGDPKEKEIAACALHRLSAHEQNRSVIAREGAVPPLLDLIRNGTARQKDQAAAAVAGLAVRNDGNKLLIARAGGVAALVGLARDGTDRQKSLAVRGLYCLAKDEGIRDEIYRRGGMEPIVELVKKEDTLPDLKRYAGAALRLFDARAPSIIDTKVVCRWSR